MPSPDAIAPSPSTTHFQLSTVNSRLFCPKPFRFKYFRKNASATPLESHTFKTKDLKPFRITYFQKKGRGWVPLSNIQPQTPNLCFSLSPLASALTSFTAANPFRFCTYKKHTGGEGGTGGTPRPFCCTLSRSSQKAGPRPTRRRKRPATPGNGDLA